jgi:hypothetical protein
MLFKILFHKTRAESWELWNTHSALHVAYFLNEFFELKCTVLMYIYFRRTQSGLGTYVRMKTCKAYNIFQEKTEILKNISEGNTGSLGRY